MADFKQDLVVNLGGNVPRKAKEYGRSLSMLGTNGARRMSMLKRGAQAAGKQIDSLGNRYTGLISTLGIGLAAKGVGDLDDHLKEIQVQAGRTDEEISKLKETIFSLSQDKRIKTAPTELVAAFDAVIEKTGDFKLANDNLENMAIAIRASGGSGKEIGAIVAGLKKLGITASDDVMAAFNLMNEQGKAGAFTMKMIATEAGPMLARMAALGYSGLEAVRVMGAIAQTTQDTTDSAAETGTAFVALLREIVAKGKLLHDNEIQVFDQAALDLGKEKFLELDVILNNIMKATDGKMSKLGKIFGEEAQKAVTNLAAGHGKKDNMFSRMMGVSPADNQLILDATEKASTMNKTMVQLNATLTRLANQNLSGPLQTIADFVGAMDPSTLNGIATGLTAIGVGAGSMIIGAKAIKGGMSVARFVKGLRGNKAGGLLAAGSEALAGGQRVFVTNWPIGGLGGGAGAMGGAKRGARGKNLGTRFNTQKIRALSSKFRPAAALAKTGGGWASKLSWLSKGKGLLKRVPYLGAILTGASLLSLAGDASASTGEKLKGGGSALGGLGGAAAGGMAGAAIGSVVPIVGTLIGGLLGSIAGGLAGEFGGEKIGEQLAELIDVTKENGPAKVNITAGKDVSVQSSNNAEMNYYMGQMQLGG